MENIEKLGDRELYAKCQLYGSNARQWAKKFAALLPEVDKRQLYKKHGFYSIFEFAAKLAGMGRETVVDILWVARKLQDKPILKAQMEEQGWAKLRVVANVATIENQKILAEKVKIMSKPTLETFIKELRQQNHELVQSRPGTAKKHETLAISQNAMSGEVPTPPRISVRIPLKPKTELRLRELQKKLSKMAHGPVDFNEVLETLLDTYAAVKTGALEAKEEQAQSLSQLEEIAKEKEQRLQQFEAQAKEKVYKLANSPPSRHIPAVIKKFLSAKFKGRCAYKGCMKLPKIFHHTRRFALNQSHNPDFLMPLCKEHERLAHLGLIDNEEKTPDFWRTQIFPNTNSPKYTIDKIVNSYRGAVCALGG
ncbi:hypothetical protein HYW83_05650 [Candidatus Peregrinibacteria bacterium]|nr:hypothetical protein [Candidatus Peregrinibacteria bacterium]